VLWGAGHAFPPPPPPWLVVARDTLPEVLEVTAWTEDGVIMGLRHRHYPIEGVQFHPESVLTTEGPRLIANWLRQVKAWHDASHTFTAAQP